LYPQPIGLMQGEQLLKLFQKDLRLFCVVTAAHQFTNDFALSSHMVTALVNVALCQRQVIFQHFSIHHH
jgi:hypothetical protein